MIMPVVIIQVHFLSRPTDLVNKIVRDTKFVSVIQLQ